MNTSLKIFFFGLMGAFLPITVNADGCGNDEPCGTTGDCCPGSGANPYSPYTYNLNRKITDLAVSGAVIPLNWERKLTSRYRSGLYTPLGEGGSWRHSGFWRITEGNSNSGATKTYTIEYPSGNSIKFTKAWANDPYLRGPASIADRLEKDASGNNFKLWFSGGDYIRFVRTGTSTTDFMVQAAGDSTGRELTYGYAGGRLATITEPGGRWISITYGAVDWAGKPIISRVDASDGQFVEYSYGTHTAPNGYFYTILTQAAYSDGTQATYTYQNANRTDGNGRPLPKIFHDVRYSGPMVRIEYEFDVNNDVYGAIKTEKSGVTGTVVSSLNYLTRTETRGDGPSRTFTYSAFYLQAKPHWDGTSTAMTYDTGKGWVNTKTDPLGRTTTYTWENLTGKPTKITYADTKFEQFEYTDANKPYWLKKHTDELGRITTNTYDASNRVTRKDYPDLSYETWTYNAFGQPLTHRLRNSGTETMTYDPTGLLLTRTDAGSNTSVFTYNVMGRVATATDPRGNTTSYLYNQRGQVTRITHPDATFAEFTYDAYGNRLTAKNELGKVTTYAYDEYKRLSSVTDPLNRTTQYSYGLLSGGGCGSCHTDSDLTRVTLPSGKQSTFTYDAEHRRLTATVGYGTPDAAITSYAYDAVGNQTGVTDPLNRTTTFTYDQRDRRLTTTDPLNHVTTWTYDGVGNILTEKLADNTITSYQYDSMNRRTKMTNPLAGVTQFAYDAGGRLTGLTDAKNHSYTFQYDLRDLKTKMIYPGGGYEQWTYDAAENLATHRTRAGWVMTCSYNTRNWDTSCVWNDGGWTPDGSKTYDLAGRVLTINNPNSELTYAYDDAGQLTSEAQKIMPLNVTKTIAYTYSLDGLRSTVTYPDGKVFDYTYNARQQVVDINLNALTNPLVHYVYDQAGQRSKRVFNNFTETDYLYDADGRTTQVKHSNASGPFDKREYGYNVVNNRAWEKRDSLLGDAYTYDATGQVTGVKYDATNPDSVPSSPARTETFSYDGVGNRTTYVGSGTATFSVDNLNEYTGHVFNGTAQPIYNDTDGNLILISFFDGANRIYSHDGLGRMAFIENALDTVTLLYDGRNRCVAKIYSNGATNYFSYDGWNVIEEYDGQGNQLAATAHGVRTDEPIFRWAAGSILCYYHQDALGSVTRLTDTSGVVVEKYSYDAYGQPKILDALNQPRSVSFFGNRMMFTGREWDRENRIYDYRNRYYAPQIGRFLEPDPIRFQGQDVNLYRYCFNNPVNATDPMGLCVKGDVKNEGSKNPKLESTLGGGISSGEANSGFDGLWVGEKGAGAGGLRGSSTSKGGTASDMGKGAANAIEGTQNRNQKAADDMGISHYYFTGFLDYRCCECDSAGTWDWGGVRHQSFQSSTFPAGPGKGAAALAAATDAALAKAKTACK